MLSDSHINIMNAKEWMFGFLDVNLDATPGYFFSKNPLIVIFINQILYITKTRDI